MFIKGLAFVRPHLGQPHDGAELQSRTSQLEDQVAELRATTTQLQSDLQQARRLHRRLAELTDIVEHVLLLQLEEPAGASPDSSGGDGRLR